MEIPRPHRTKAARLLLDGSATGARLRRRAAAASGVTLFFLGLFVAVGLGLVVLALLVAAGAGAAVTAAVARIRRRGLHGALVGMRRAAAASSGAARAGAVATARAAGPRVAALGTAARDRARVSVPRVAALGTAARDRARLTAPRVAALRTAARDRLATARQDPRQEAVRLNAEGAQLRRDGDRSAALERHRAALDAFREVGDRHGEALTLNNLALALARDDDAEATRHFEESVAILRELGDRQEEEGKVLVNLAFAHRRQGNDGEAVAQLEAALTKLEPSSAEREQVERELRRAS